MIRVTGLSKFGIRLIEEMNRLGILIDLSHCGDETVMDAIEFSKDPVVISHSNVRSLVDFARNRSNEQIKVRFFPSRACAS